MLGTAKSFLSRAVVGALLEVHADLGPGYLERTYHEAVAMALADHGIPFQREAPVPVRFLGRPLQTVHRVDFVCGGKLLLEVKAQLALGHAEESQVLHCLKGSRLPLAILANFGEEPLAVRRLVGTSYDPGHPI